MNIVGVLSYQKYQSALAKKSIENSQKLHLTIQYSKLNSCDKEDNVGYSVYSKKIMTNILK
jgi:hypothetical protein